MFNVAIMLTWMRIILIPLLIVVFYLPIQFSGLFASMVFIVAAVTDVLDGYLARRTQQVTRFGAFLDPVADKLIIATALALIIEHAGTWVVTMPALVIISREIAVSALREWMAEIGGSQVVAVTFLGKLKTTIQMIAIAILLLQDSMFGLPTFTIGLILLYLAMLLTIWSMLTYLLMAYRHIVD